MINFIYNEAYTIYNYEILDFNSEEVKNLHIDVDYVKLKEASESIKADISEYLTVIMVINDYSIECESLNKLTEEQFIKLRNHMVYYNAYDFNNLKDFYKKIISDAKYFPVPKSNESDDWVSFIDSWGYDRDYKGQRRHEGTDIMADINEAGVYPIVSMCDGTVENIGWLELGGYRIGIRSKTGLYYYYAHLDSYTEGLCVGSSVKAGEFIGFMGNTGYSKVEGTKGKFDVHLHMGLYMDVEGLETAFNPYYILKNLKENVLYYNY